MNYRFTSSQVMEMVPDLEAVIGPSPDGEEAWVSEINLVLGVDLKVLASGYGTEFKIKKPPRSAGKELKPFREYPMPPRGQRASRPLPTSLLVNAAWPSSWTTSLPSLSWSESDPVMGTPIKGSRPRHGALWRSGVVLDFDKSQPTWATSYGTKNTYRLPARDFVKELEGAFDSKLTEVSMYF